MAVHHPGFAAQPVVALQHPPGRIPHVNWKQPGDGSPLQFRPVDTPQPRIPWSHRFGLHPHSAHGDSLIQRHFHLGKFFESNFH